MSRFSIPLRRNFITSNSGSESINLLRVRVKAHSVLYRRRKVKCAPTGLHLFLGSSYGFMGTEGMIPRNGVNHSQNWQIKMEIDIAL